MQVLAPFGSVRRVAAALAAAAASIAVSPGARACSLSEDFVPAHNYDLVAHADAIVVAEAVANVSAEEWSGVRFRAVQALKGRPPLWFTAGAGLGHPPFSDPNGLAEANPEALQGACQRYTYRRGGLYVMFLRREEGEWREIDYPYARANEDYFGPESVWVRAIRTYVSIQARYDGEEEVRALQRLEEEYRQRADNQYGNPYDETWAVLAEDLRWRRHPQFEVSPYLTPSGQQPTWQQVAAGLSVDYEGEDGVIRRPGQGEANAPRGNLSMWAALAGFIVLLGSIGWALWASVRANRPS